MKKIYAYDNSEGDKGIIIADSFDEAIQIYMKEYPEKNIASNDEEYWDNGCYIEEVDYVEESKLYVTCPW